jgi:hypothetical protein
MARLQQIPGHRVSHDAQTDKSDIRHVPFSFSPSPQPMCFGGSNNYKDNGFSPAPARDPSVTARGPNSEPESTRVREVPGDPESERASATGAIEDLH